MEESPNLNNQYSWVGSRQLKVRQNKAPPALGQSHDTGNLKAFKISKNDDFFRQTMQSNTEKNNLISQNGF